MYDDNVEDSDLEVTFIEDIDNGFHDDFDDSIFAHLPDDDEDPDISDLDNCDCDIEPNDDDFPLYLEYQEEDMHEHSAPAWEED